MMKQYHCRKVSGPVNGKVTVPGSKSITNRALLMAALSDGKCVIKGVLFSDDTKYFLESLRSLGYRMRIDRENHTVVVRGNGKEIPKKEANIFVGSAGTAARFLTAMLGVSEGTYTVQCSEQMKRRPMKPLFDALTELGARITYLEEEGCLPVRIENNHSILWSKVTLDISKSTQFLSALLMVAPLLPNGLTIDVISQKKTGSYIGITMKMMREFGVNVTFNGECYTVDDWQVYRPMTYQVEPDMSAACYFYAAAAVTGGSILVNHIHGDISQGDKKFLTILQRMGCHIVETTKGIAVTGPDSHILRGITVDMNDFSDQAMTLAAIAPFADSDVVIANIAHVRGQESDRIAAMAEALREMGIECEEKPDGIVIHPGPPHAALIDTHNDHRMAMAFAITGLRAEGIVIENPMCCKKTFADYFEVLDQLLDEQK